MEKEAAITGRLQALREQMRRRNIAAYIVPTDDFHSSEYVGDYFKAREYLSGFTGSAGTLLVEADRASLWTDGRYFLQAQEQLKGSGITLMKSGQPGVLALPDYLGERLSEGDVIGFDGRCVTGAFVEKLKEKTAQKQIAFCGEEDLAGLVWQGRPPLPAEPVWELSTDYAGLTREEKLAGVREKLAKKQADALLTTDLSEIAWLFNLRGNDVKHTPVFLAYLLLTKDGAALCAQESAFSEEIREKLACAGVSLHPYESIEVQAASLPVGTRLLADARKVNYRLLQAVPAGVERVDGESPIELLKAVKTQRETANIRAAHVKDGVAVTRFVRWLKMCAGEETVTEIRAAKKLEEFRTRMEGYLGPGFDPIIAYGPHGAIVHYEAAPETDAAIQPVGFCLADTGGHYREGTTDVTRTIALGELTAEEKKAYTLVLKGHLRLGAAKFPQGACGQNLDALAREPLWQEGLDYNHGTGHGVGYLLSVHEGPQSFRWRISKEASCVPLEEGMILSNEPGLYVAGKFGIRHENLVLVRKGEKNDFGQFMYLEPLTMVPFDREAIDAGMMCTEEIRILNAYHQKVYETISPYFAGEELAWLERATAPL
ncbi:MAG: aminopeptidase P family protein [Lachnospiraceae bacterium]|nr:aminopeptidase P family protein [Lachnospiraceae bacterium]